MSQVEVEKTQAQGQAFVAGNIVLRTLFKQAMSMLFGSIIMIQILAHLPLADIVLPANALQQFDIMIGFVSFDYFQPTEFYDVGFTPMPFWPPNFDWLGYGSINFVEGLGSILIFAFIQVLFGLIVFSLMPCMYRIRFKYIQNNFSRQAFFNSTVNFIHGTFFEILVCVSISMQMLYFREFLNDKDMVSIIL